MAAPSAEAGATFPRISRQAAKCLALSQVHLEQSLAYPVCRKTTPAGQMLMLSRPKNMRPDFRLGIFLIDHTSAIEEARSERKVAVGSFIRIENAETGCAVKSRGPQRFF